MLNRRQRLPCSKTAIERAKELRANLTVGEATIWVSLKGKSMRG
jgi:hypothetical protein